jgi:hypothetical protein
MFKKFCTKARCIGRLCSCSDAHEDDDDTRPVKLSKVIRSIQNTAGAEAYPAFPPSENESHTGGTPQSSNSSSSNAFRGTKRSIKEAQQDDNSEPQTNYENSEGSSKRQRSDDNGGEDREFEDSNSEDNATRLARFRQSGQRYQKWIEDANAPGCIIQPATLTLDDLLTEPEENRWEDLRTYDWEEGSRPLFLDGGDLESTNLGKPHYRNITLQRWVVGVEDYTSYIHANARGIIAVSSMFRHGGPYWNEIAKALYEIEHPIATLRHVAFEKVENVETNRWITKEAYPNFNDRNGESVFFPIRKFERGTREFEELLGTQLGRATATLVISAFPRGTKMISRAVTWVNGSDVNLRFEIADLVGQTSSQAEP